MGIQQVVSPSVAPARRALCHAQIHVRAQAATMVNQVRTPTREMTVMTATHVKLLMAVSDTDGLAAN